MSEVLSIYFVGELWEGTTALMRFRALEQLGHKVYAINIELSRVSNRSHSTWSRIKYKLYRMHLLPRFRFKDLAGLNDAILNHVRSVPTDVLWLDKALGVRPQTLYEVKRTLPRCMIVGYSPDDMAARHNQTSDFVEGLPLYDFYFTTKTYGVEELKALGCPRVHFVPNAFDPATHRPIPLTPEEKAALGGGVGFIGHYEADRARSMRFLASHGIPVRIYGGGWKSKHVHDNLRVEGRHAWGHDYAKVLCSFDINLCFLRRLNRDRQTQRSVEIPACGSFMLAERTAEHLELFREGVEAEFFSSDQELLDKARYYLAHPEERTRIALAGRKRCVDDGYSYVDRLRSILEKARAELRPVVAGVPLQQS